jgi:hypothetical protein
MATIPRAALDYVTEQVNGLSADAQAKVLKVLESIEWTPDNISECRDLVIQALDAVMPTYTDAAAQSSADFYDASRELAVGERLGAKAVSGYDPAATAGAVRAFVRYVLDGRVQTFNDQVLQRIDYEMKLSAANSTLENGRRDPLKPKYARVPTGAETCDFCLMLASRGFVYHTESTASMGHVHAGCVLPDTVLGALDVKALLRRKFEGDVIDITTRGGRHLSVTANHPILTVNGWVKAGLLHDGDALLCGFTGEGHDFGVPSVDNRPPSAEQVFEALRLLDAAYPVGVEVSTVDFYGETVTNGDVEVIDVNRLLKGHIVSVGHESFGDKSFSVGALFERCKRLNGAGAANFGDGTRSLPSCCVMRGLGLSCPVLRGHLGGADESCFGASSAMDSGIVEPSVNDLPGDAVSLGQLQDALSALVSLDEIGRCGDAVRSYLDSVALEYTGDALVGDSKLFGNRLDTLPSGIEIDYVSVANTRHFIGHVYNLSAGGHWYTANGIITHNCDCRIVPGWDGMEVADYDDMEIYERWQGIVRAKARERAERNGTDESDEYAAIMDGYGRAATRAKKSRNKA